MKVMNYKNRLIILVCILLMLGSCSKDPYSKFVGFWKYENGKKVAAFEIVNKGADFFITLNIASNTPQESHLLFKEQGALVLNPKANSSILIEPTTDENFIKIKKERYEKTTKSEVSNLKYRYLTNSVIPQNKQRIEQALFEYYLDVGQLPKNFVSLAKDTGDKNWMGPYVREKDLLDAWGNQYLYEVSDKSVKLITLGEDGVTGGEGVNQDIDLSFAISS